MSYQRLTTHTIRSGALVKSMRLRVYTPPGPPPYPVVYLLHPWGEDECYWTDHLNFHQTADHLITQGVVPPFMAVMPQGDKSFFINAAAHGGDFSQIVDLDPHLFEGAMEGYGDYGDYILDDVIPEVEHRYPVIRKRSARVIAGISMGGVGAGVLAFSEPEVFGAVGMHSPALDWLVPPWIFGLGDPDALAQRDPVHLAQHLSRYNRPNIYIDCGTNDDLCRAVSDLHYVLEQNNIPHRYEIRAGNHTPTYWLNHMAEYIGFYAARW